MAKKYIPIAIYIFTLFVIGAQHNRVVNIKTLYERDMNIMKQKVEEAKASADDDKSTLSMASEFHFDPTIVDIVRKNAKAVFDVEDPAWRFIQSPDFAAHLMLSMIYVESKGDPNIIGDHGKAVGLTQIWLTTANDYEKISKEDLLLPENNIRISFLHFKHLLEKYNGNFALALYAWNRGAGKVDKLIAYGQPVENNYAARVYRAELTAMTNYSE